MHVTILKETGLDEALLGLSLSYNCPPGHDMLKVAHKLANKDGGHNKFLESIIVWLDIDAPREWWQQYDTYRTGTTKQSECYDDATEVLTISGWKYWPNVSTDDLFATMNINTGAFEYQAPSAIVRSEYTGDMIRVKNAKVDLLVTPNHRFLYAANPGGPLKLAPISKLSSRNFFVPKLAKWDAPDIPEFVIPEMTKTWHTGCRECTKHWPELRVDMDDWLKFLGIFISQGSTTKAVRNYTICITHNTYDGTDAEVDELLNRLGFRYQKLYPSNTASVRWTISHKQLYGYLAVLGKAKSKFVPQDFKHLSKRQLSILLEWLHKGDGTKAADRTGYILYSTASKALADDVQEISIKCGYMANVYKREDDAGHTLYTVNRQHTSYYAITPNYVSPEPYTGLVHCAEVPNHTLLVRRNGRTTWCGNSTMHTLTKRLLTQEDFEDGVDPRSIAIVNEYIQAKDWRRAKLNLPEGFLQRRIVTTCYKTLRNIIWQRADHRLPPWQQFVQMVLYQVQYPKWIAENYQQLLE